MVSHLTIEVQDCPRCRRKHKKVRFVKLARPIVENQGMDKDKYPQTTWTHYGNCPATDEPILMFESVYFTANPLI